MSDFVDTFRSTLTLTATGRGGGGPEEERDDGDEGGGGQDDLHRLVPAALLGLHQPIILKHEHRIYNSASWYPAIYIHNSTDLHGGVGGEV